MSLGPACSKDEEEQDEDGDEELPKEEAKVFRGVAARVNYPAQDRPDIQYAAKEACRDMSSPKYSSWRAEARGQVLSE